MTGRFGSWRYYNVIMKIKDIVDPETGVKTVPEARKIYSSKNLNQILQRALDPKRIEPIKEYILRQQDRYFNSMTVGISGGDPKWHPVAIREEETFTKEEIAYLNLKYGILELSGKEDLFVLDGQHRLIGLMEAYKANKGIGEEEISLMLVVHKDSPPGLKRTRRVFVALNRNAKPVSEGENIILEEDDVSAIVARYLVEKFSLFKNREVIAYNKNLNLKIGRQDANKFSSILALYKINEHLIDNDTVYKHKVGKKHVRIRPGEKIITESYKKAETFWDTFFRVFSGARSFIVDYENHKDLRNNRDGGVFYLRPIGQELIVRLYMASEKRDFDRIKKVEPKLNSNFWNYVLWNPHKRVMLTNGSYAYNYLKYNLGFPLKQREIERVRTNYKRNSGELELELPAPLFR